MDSTEENHSPHFSVRIGMAGGLARSENAMFWRQQVEKEFETVPRCWRCCLDGASFENRVSFWLITRYYRHMLFALDGIRCMPCPNDINDSLI